MMTVKATNFRIEKMERTTKFSENLELRKKFSNYFLLKIFRKNENCNKEEKVIVGNKLG